jgi:N-acetylglucosaminyl-diphospho-decaprenol L-rhamnosyltransferase
VPPLAVSYSGLLGGAERLLVEVAAGLADPPLLACPPGALSRAARARGLGVFELRGRSLELRHSIGDRIAAPARIGAHGAEVRSIARSVHPDALIAWGMRAGLAVATAYPAGAGPPLLFQHHDLMPGPLIARAVRHAATRADLVVTPSDCVARELEPSATVGQRLQVVRPGVDLARFRPRVAAASLDVVLLGAIEPWKRPELALEAVALAARELPALHLRVVGTPIGAAGGALLERLRRRAYEPDLRGRVTFGGLDEHPEQTLAAAHCLLHCADREPYGMVVAEAMASGRPVVVPDSCGPGEIAEPSYARLYRPGDPHSAARALVEVLGDPELTARMGAAARESAERRLDVRDTQARYAELVSRLTGAWPVGARPAPRPGAQPTVPTGGRPAPAPGATPTVPTGTRPAPHRGGQLTVLTVLHDSEAELAALMSSLEEHLPEAQLVVVDSGSSDGGPELARRWRDGAVELVELGHNAGFGRGVNAGLPLARRPITAVLNPDVALGDASLAAAAREALRGPERLLAPLILRPDGSREDNAQREPGSPALLAHALVPGAALPRPLDAVVEPWRSVRPRRVGWPVGSCIVARTATLRRLGPFDQRTFMYAEDLDLGLRAADAGIATWFWPAARVVHQGAHSSLPAFGGEPFDLLARRRRAVVLERRGPNRARVDDLLQLLTFADRLVLKRLAGRDAERERRQLAARARLVRRAGRGAPA